MSDIKDVWGLAGDVLERIKTIAMVAEASDDIGAKDPAASAALLAYADKAEQLGYDSQYVSDVRAMAIEFEYYRKDGDGDPCAPPHRKDDPATVKLMSEGRGA